MDKLFTILIIAAAVWYLYRRFKRMADPEQGCGCSGCCDCSGTLGEKSKSDTN